MNLYKKPLPAKTILPEYIVKGNMIVDPKNRTAIEDFHIVDLYLSVRTWNCLMRENKETVAEILQMAEGQFNKISGLGATSREEFKKETRIYFNTHAKPIDVESPLNHALVYDILKDEEPSYEECGMPILLHLFKDTPFIRFTQNDMVKKLKEEMSCGSIPEIDDLLLWIEMTDKSSDGELLKTDDGYYQFVYPSFIDFVKFLEAQKDNYPFNYPKNQIIVLKARLEGQSIEEISDTYNASESTIISTQRNAIQKTKTLGKYYFLTFKEDEYKELFKKYKLDREFFLDYLNVTPMTWTYLKINYGREKIHPGHALNDASLSTQVKEIIKKWLDDKHKFKTKTLDIFGEN